jgi:hypothetical protein
MKMTHPHVEAGACIYLLIHVCCSVSPCVCVRLLSCVHSCAYTCVSACVYTCVCVYNLYTCVFACAPVLCVYHCPCLRSCLHPHSHPRVQAQDRREVTNVAAYTHASTLEAHTFDRVLLNTCQNEFESLPTTFEATAEDAGRVFAGGSRSDRC